MNTYVNNHICYMITYVIWTWGVLKKYNHICYMNVRSIKETKRWGQLCTQGRARTRPLLWPLPPRQTTLQDPGIPASSACPNSPTATIGDSLHLLNLVLLLIFGSHTSSQHFTLQCINCAASRGDSVTAYLNRRTQQASLSELSLPLK